MLDLVLASAVRHPREFRLAALVHHCGEVGLGTVPIVALMAFLIGVVPALQGTAQRRQFGAEVVVVDLIAVSILGIVGISGSGRSVLLRTILGLRRRRLDLRGRHLARAAARTGRPARPRST